MNLAEWLIQLWPCSLLVLQDKGLSQDLFFPSFYHHTYAANMSVTQLWVCLARQRWGTLYYLEIMLGLSWSSFPVMTSSIKRTALESGVHQLYFPIWLSGYVRDRQLTDFIWRKGGGKARSASCSLQLLWWDFKVQMLDMQSLLKLDLPSYHRKSVRKTFCEVIFVLYSAVH